MNTWIVFYYRASAVERRMVRSLESGGIRVLLARSIGSMHNLMTEKTVSVVIVPLSIVKRHHIRVRIHLVEAKSTISAIYWLQRENGTIATQCSTCRDRSLDSNVASENYRLALSAALLMRAAGSGRSNHIMEANDCTPEYNAGFCLPELPEMHRKMRRILECIAASGESGTSPEHIASEIWPESECDRIHDVQSYISKLRGILARAPRTSVRIVYTNRRYRIVSGEQGPGNKKRRG